MKQYGCDVILVKVAPWHIDNLPLVFHFFTLVTNRSNFVSRNWMLLKLKKFNTWNYEIMKLRHCSSLLVNFRNTEKIGNVWAKETVETKRIIWAAELSGHKTSLTVISAQCEPCGFEACVVWLIAQRTPGPRLF